MKKIYKTIVCFIIIGSLLAITNPSFGKKTYYVDNSAEELSKKDDSYIQKSISVTSVPVTSVISREEMLEILWNVEFKNSIDKLTESINKIDFSRIEKPLVPAITSDTKIEINTDVTEIIPKEKNIIFMEKISSVKDFLSVPTREVFKEQYDYALSFYNAILNKESTISFGFDFGEYKDNLEIMNKFISNFEGYVLNGLFRLDGVYTYGGINSYTGSPSDIYNEILLYNKFIDVVKSIGITEYTSQKEAVIKINNWLCDYLSYKGMSNNPYIAYTTKFANCDAYAVLFERLCQTIGIEATWESGTVKSGGKYGAHAWNKVKIDNNWYYIDVCWNDSVTPNKYLLSSTLWNNHTRNVALDLPTDGYPLGDTVNIKNIYDISNLVYEPTKEVFGEYYSQAMDIYNGILNSEDSVEIKLVSETIDVYTLYEDFQEKFIRYVLGGGCELYFETVSWRPSDNFVSAKIITNKIYDKFSEYVFMSTQIHGIISSLKIDNNTREFEAISKIVQYLNKFDYDGNNRSIVESLNSKKINNNVYAELFYNLCENLNIECEVVKGFRGLGENKYSGYWNRVKIGDSWYYIDMSYYSDVDYRNAGQNKYFLSNNLWDTHLLKK